jgi:hypothetical protein
LASKATSMDLRQMSCLWVEMQSENAERDTLFLDEIGELTDTLFLDEIAELTPLGGIQEERGDHSIVASIQAFGPGDIGRRYLRGAR